MKSTTVLIVICVISSLVYWHIGVDKELLTQILGFSGKFFLQGYVWTLFTALFIHGDLMHLMGNMIFLYVFGGTLEDEVGPRKTISAFFIGGFLSFILSVLFYGYDAIMIGASAAIFTLVAIVMLVKPLKFSWLFFMPLGLVAIIYFIYNAASAFFFNGEENVGYLAHIIGFVIGFPFGIAWSRRKWMRNVMISIVFLIAYYILMSYFGSLLEMTPSLA